MEPMEPTKRSEPRRFYGRPADRSLQAYKDFILGMTLALTQAKDEITEDEWRRAWQEFWAAAHDASAPDQ
jgi:hypothetical protein